MKKFVAGLATGIVVATTAVAGASGTNVSALYGNMAASVDGKTVQLKSLRYNDENYVKVRDLASNVGATVDYDANSKMVTISTKSIDPTPSPTSSTTGSQLQTLAGTEHLIGAVAYVRKGKYADIYKSKMLGEYDLEKIAVENGYNRRSNYDFVISYDVLPEGWSGTIRLIFLNPVDNNKKIVVLATPAGTYFVDSGSLTATFGANKTILNEDLSTAPAVDSSYKSSYPEWIGKKVEFVQINSEEYGSFVPVFGYNAFITVNGEEEFFIYEKFAKDSGVTLSTPRYRQPSAGITGKVVLMEDHPRVG